MSCEPPEEHAKEVGCAHARSASQVKLLKLLSRRMASPAERSLLPALLNVFYFRETLFIVYELLRDNLYHIYKV